MLVDPQYPVAGPFQFIYPYPDAFVMVTGVLSTLTRIIRKRIRRCSISFVVPSLLCIICTVIRGTGYMCPPPPSKKIEGPKYSFGGKVPFVQTMLLNTIRHRRCLCVSKDMYVCPLTQLARLL